MHTWEHKLIWDNIRLDKNLLKQFSLANVRKGSVATDIIGFIDGTVIPISRPGENQQYYYNGYKRLHAIKFQSVVTPDGIISHMTGPWNGIRHDSGMLVESQLLDFLQENIVFDDCSFRIYGDKGYGYHRLLLSSFKGSFLSDEEKAINLRMSKCRICVEWQFGKILQLWAFVDFEKNLKINLQPVPEYYLVATILTNCHCCYYNNQTNMYFNLHKTNIQEYLGNYFFWV